MKLGGLPPGESVWLSASNTRTIVSSCVGCLPNLARMAFILSSARSTLQGVFAMH